MIKLDGLNKEQTALCEILWALDSSSELNTFLMGLPDRLRKEAETLVQLIFMEHVNQMEFDLQPTNDMLNKIFNKGE